MTQNKFDIAEQLLNNKAEIFKLIHDDIQDSLKTEGWFLLHGLEESFRQAIEDLIVYKMQCMMLEHTSIPWEELVENIDKGFVVDLFGPEVLEIEFWRNLQ